MKSNDFNRIAPMYDAMAWLVFGGRLLRAERQILPYLSASKKVLSVGGGTGKLLPFLPEYIELTYVEASSKMISQSKKRSCEAKISFVQQDVLQHQGAYDTVIAPFFLDCFHHQSLVLVVQHLHTLIQPGGQLLVTDFQPAQKLRQKWLLALMHGFFRLTTNLQSKSLIDIDAIIQSHGFELINKTSHHNHAIFSAQYRKS